MKPILYVEYPPYGPETLERAQAAMAPKTFEQTMHPYYGFFRTRTTEQWLAMRDQWVEDARKQMDRASSDRDRLLEAFRAWGYSPRFLIDQGYPKTYLNNGRSWSCDVQYNNADWDVWGWTTPHAALVWHLRNPWAKQGMLEYQRQSRPPGLPAEYQIGPSEAFGIEMNRAFHDYKIALLKEMQEKTQ